MRPIPSDACTSLALNNTFPVFATNYDSDKNLCLLFFNKRGVQKTGLSPNTEGEYAHWTSKYASITFNAGGFQLPWAGMNEMGLVLSTMALDATVPPEPDERYPLEYGPFWAQYILDTCATIEDVIASNMRVRHVTTVDHYLFVDRSGNAAVIELLDGEMVVFTGDDLPVAALANTVYEESISTWLPYHQAGYNDCSILDGASQHFCMAADQVAAFQPSDRETAVSYAFSALETVGSSSTQWSIVFDTSDFGVYFRTLNNREIRFLDFFAFDPLCYTPVQMLDIHSSEMGDVTSDFIDISFPACLDHLQRYLIASGVVIPAEVSEELVGIFESYSCRNYRQVTGRQMK
jgi:choloylglycine hydrolase